VEAALAALTPNLTATAALGSLDTIFGNIVTKFNAHLLQTGVHQEDDTSNDIATGAASAATPDTLSMAREKFGYHYSNDLRDLSSSNSHGVDSANFHNVGTKKNDRANMPVFAGVAALAERLVAVADLHRSLEAHRVSTAVHDTADTTNALTALPPIPALVSAYITALTSLSPTAPVWQSSGAQVLLSIGWEEAPL